MDNITAKPPLEGLRPPPRSLPWHLVCDELFGGPLSLIGWLFLGFGMVFVNIFVANADFSGWRFRGEVRQATARSSGCRSTSFSEGGGRNRPGHRIYATDFFFHDASGKAVLGTSYGWDCYQAGEDATAVYPEGRPDLARLRGLRAAPMGPSVLWILLFPLLGLAFVAVSLRQGLRELALLRRGVLARGAVTGKRATNLRVNDRMQYELDVAFKDAFGRSCAFKTKTCFPERLESEEAHNVFYDPDRPEDAIAVDTLPEPLFADFDGGLTSDGWARAAFSTLVPLLIVAAHAAYWAWRLSR